MRGEAVLALKTLAVILDVLAKRYREGLHRDDVGPQIIGDVHLMLGPVGNRNGNLIPGRARRPVHLLRLLDNPTVVKVAKEGRKDVIANRIRCNAPCGAVMQQPGQGIP